MTHGAYHPEGAIPIHDTAPSETEPLESTLLPCGCDPALGGECARCHPKPVEPVHIALVPTVREQAPKANGGGDHKDAGKPRLELLDPYAMEQVAAVLGFGAVKYSPWNWTRGIAYTRLAGSALRHIFAFMRGEDRDPESGLPHLAHGMCCLMMLLGMTQRHPELDDRCKTEAA